MLMDNGSPWGLTTPTHLLQSGLRLGTESVMDALVNLRHREKMSAGIHRTGSDEVLQGSSVTAVLPGASTCGGTSTTWSGPMTPLTLLLRPPCTAKEGPSTLGIRNRLDRVRDKGRLQFFVSSMVPTLPVD